MNIEAELKRAIQTAQQQLSLNRKTHKTQRRPTHLRQLVYFIHISLSSAQRRA